MTDPAVSELNPGVPVQGTYVVKQKEVRTTRNGDAFLSLKLGDRTGDIQAILWRASKEMIGSFEADDFVRVRGKVETYRNTLQMNLDNLMWVDPASVDPSAFLPSTGFDVDEMADRLIHIMLSLSNVDLKRLIQAFLDDGEFLQTFKRAPAAVNYHHAYLGGLLEHTLSLCEVWLLISPRYFEVDRDMVLAGIFFHDIGKTKELSADHALQYTDEGRLVGHLMQGVLMLEEKSREVGDIPEELIVRLRHVILSHHGLPEWGAVRLPMTPEAIAIHHLDNLDAKLYAAIKFVKDKPDQASSWTEKSHMLGVKLYTGADKTV